MEKVPVVEGVTRLEMSSSGSRFASSSVSSAVSVTASLVLSTAFGADPYENKAFDAESSANFDMVDAAGGSSRSREEGREGQRDHSDNEENAYDEDEFEGAQLPRAWIDKLMNKAKVERFLSTCVGSALSSDNEDGRDVSSLRESMPETRAEYRKPLSPSLQTFCSVKQARLEGKLATLQMENEWRRHHTGNETTGNAMSIATLEFMHGMMVEQRKIACVGNGTGPSLEHRASNNFEPTTVMAQTCLEESRMLVERANRLLPSTKHERRAVASN
ncbi:hypothetical protein FI667_g8156, partial [Globisporangium splendens]